MSASIDTTIADLLKGVDISSKPKVSRYDRRERLFSAFYDIARQHAEMTFLHILSSPEFVAGTISVDEIGARLDEAFEYLEAAASEELERRSMGDKLSRILAQPRLVNGFFVRIGQLALVQRSGSA